MTYRIDLPYPYPELWPNKRPHWARKAKAAKNYRDAAHWGCIAAKVPEGVPRIHVVFYPQKKGPPPDRDNAIAAFKAGQDGIADALNVNDRALDPTYEISEERGPSVTVFVTVEDEG